MCIDVIYTMAEALVTLRVPREMKEKMKKSGINWSEQLRLTIKSKLEADSKGRAEEELERLLEGVKPGFDSLEAIKEARRIG
jgi:post-segregation antitoxin (ccd killing protein)